MIKGLVRIVSLTSILVMIAYLIKQAIVILESEDDIDAPADYALNGDQSDLNGVSE